MNNEHVITAKTPWAGHTGEIPLSLQYFEGSMYDKVAQIAEQYPNSVAFDFMGKSTTYRDLISEIEKCAKALKTIGVRENDKVTIAMPNCPQAIYMFYAVNLVGGIANMIHPLSAEKEIEFYLNESESVTAITLDQFYNKFEAVRENTGVVNIIIASVKDALSKPIKAGYMLTEGRKIQKIPKDAPVIRWKEFMKLSEHCFYNYKVQRRSDDPAVILYSGGTTGTTNVSFCNIIPFCRCCNKNIYFLQNAAVVSFIVESEAYQAMTVLKRMAFNGMPIASR